MTKAGGILAHVSTRALWSPHSFLVCYLQVLIVLSLRLYWLSRGYDNTTEESNFLKGDVLVCFCCCCDKCHSPKQLRTGKGLFRLTLYKGSQGRNLEAGTEAETSGEHYSLACFC